MKNTLMLFAATALLMACAKEATPRDPVVGDTTVLGPFTGHDAPLHPDNLAPQRLAYYGTDLGWSYEHDGQIHFLFGDTAANEKGAFIEPSTQGLHDDSFGTIALADWPDPSKITPLNLPKVKIGQNPGTADVAAIDFGRPMESFKTPLGGFSNGSQEFGLFYFSKPQACRADADCGGTFRCDTGLGYVGEKPGEDKGLTLACVDGSPACVAETMAPAPEAAVAPSGLCVDPTSSAWADTPVGRMSGVAVKNLIGVRNIEEPRKYGGMREWLTNKFSNVTPRTVTDFVPGRDTQDYRSAGGEGANRRVFLWGRPGFVGVKARGRPLGLYFAYADMPAGADIDWKVHYYAGTDEKGNAKFSTDEREAAAADLDSTQAGEQPVETHDIVDQMSLSWVEPLKKWVMLYGGGLINRPTPILPSCGVLELFARDECKDVAIGNGAIRMRSADNPWGPWSPPQDVLVGGDPAKSPPELQFGPGGILRHPDCVGDTCAGSTDWDGVDPREYGFLYAANIIEQWTRPAGDGVDLIWEVSTWDPYRIVLVRTHIRR